MLITAHDPPHREAENTSFVPHPPCPNKQIVPSSVISRAVRLLSLLSFGLRGESLSPGSCVEKWPCEVVKAGPTLVPGDFKMMESCQKGGLVGGGLSALG